MGLRELVGRGLTAIRRFWGEKSARGSKHAGRRRRLFKRLLVESLEGRDLLAADFLYSLEARPGAPDEGFGFAVAANDQFHVVSNFAPNLTYYFLEEQPDYESFFYGEIQVHDATTGDLLRTIQNPLPFGGGGFGNYGEFNFNLVAPNSFGYSIDIFENLILVGSPGWEGDFDYEFDAGDHDTGGRAFLFDAETGDLLHTFDGSYFPQPPGGQPGQSPGGLNNDGFGRSVSIDGNRIAIGAHGPSYQDVEHTVHDIDPGRVYIYSATTGNQLHLLELPNPNQVETLDFGATVSLSDGKLVVTQGDWFFTEWESDYGFGPARVYDVQTGDLLHTLPVDGFEAVIEGNNIAILEAPGTTHLVNATTGAVTQTIPGRLYDFDGNLIVTGPASGDPTAFPVIRDFPTGNVLYSVPTPPGFVEAYFEYNQIPQLFGDRLFVPGWQGAASEDVVFVYSVTDGPSNSPPTDIALTNNSVPENSANGTVIGTLSANDPDPGETFTFELINSAGGRFALNGNQVVVADGSLLDFEADSTHPIVVHVTDSAGNVFGEILTIQLTNINEPTDIALSPNTVPENSANGTIVGTLTATDLDPNETFTFELLSTAGGRFALDGDQIIVANGNAIDYEALPFHTLAVQVTDSTGNTFSEGVLIVVTNVNEPPTSIGISNDQVLENTLGGAVGLLTSNDPDNPDAQTFELLDNAGGRFALAGSIITVANGNLLDFETNTSHAISVRVTDSVGHQFTGQVTINVLNVNESPTDIALSNATVPESTVRVIHSLSADGTAFGGEVAAAGDYILASEQFGVFPATQKRVQVIHATTGEQLRILTAPVLNPNAGVPDGRFGDSFAISGNLAYIGAYSTKVGNLDEAGAVYIFDITSGNLLFTLNSPTPTASGFFGGTLAVSGNLLAVSATNEATGTIYLFNATTGQLLEAVTNPTPAPLEAFGQFLALSGNTVVSSSRFEDVGAADAGVAYIFEFNPATSIATLTHTLNNPTPASSEFFGAAVAVAGNFVAVKDSTAVAGATNVGSVHLFNRSTGVFLRTIENPAPGATDQFGAELIISGDLVIASSASDIGGANNGRAYVFQGSTGALVATIQNPSPAASDEFAFRLAASGNRIVASAVGDDTDGSNRGLVYVFELSIGQPIGTLSTTDPDAGDTFTYTLTNNADGRFAIDGNQLVIADATKLNFEAGTLHNVTVQVADAVGNTFSKDFTITVTPENEPPQDIQISSNSVSQGKVRHFHHPSVAKTFGIGYDTAADGDLVVAGTNNLTNNAGEVYVLNATTGDLVSMLASPSPQIGEVFGEKVAISGNRVVVSARGRDSGTISNAGQAHVFNATTGALLFTLNPLLPFLNGSFGTDVAIAGDVIAIADTSKVYLYSASTGSLLYTTPGLGVVLSIAIDGNTIVIGILSNQTQVYEFNPATQIATLTRTLNNPTSIENDFFGFHVAIEGSKIAVGAFLNDQQATDSGRVYVFDRASGSLLQSISNPSPAADDQFGHSIALQGNFLAVAAQNDDTDATNTGQVYLFNVTTGSLLSTIKNPSPHAGDFFSRVSFAGGRLVVGSPTDDTDGNNLGMVYVFDLIDGLTAGNLATTDPDVGGSISYSLVDDAGGRFAVQGSSIVVANASLIDANVNSLHSVIVRSTDSTGLSTTEVFAIPVVGGAQPPTNITFTGNSVVEQAANLTVVSTLATADPNAGDTFTYSLISSAGGRFGILGNTVVVNNGIAIDYSTSPEHSIVVRVTDSSGLSTFESFRITVIDAPELFDFGDLPNTFGTTLASNGPRHLISNGLRLGAAVTSEANGQPANLANLDVGDDGVTLPAGLIPGLNAIFTVNASQAGRLDVFFDSTGSDSSFSNLDRVTPAAGLMLSPGANTFSIPIFETTEPGSRGVRFRISSVGGLSPTGLAADGEVEDYRVNVVALPLDSVQVLPDPEAPGATLMLVNGTLGDDTIVVAPFNNQLRATINGVNKLPLAPLTVSRIFIFGRNGNDDISINQTAIPGYIEGGNGNDTLRGGNGPDVLFGRAGNDMLYGRDGDDLLFGGIGNDTLNSDAGIGYLFGEADNDTLNGNGVLVGGSGTDSLYANGARNVLLGGAGVDSLFGASVNEGDIIVAGSTVHDANLTALKAIHNEWKKNAPVLTRIANLNGSATGGLNGPYYLNAATVLADGQVDLILNFSSIPTLLDWVLKSPSDNKPTPFGIVLVTA